MQRNILILVSAICILCYTVYDHFGRQADESVVSSEQSDAHIEVGNKTGNRAPPIELASLRGETIRLSDYAGMKVFVNFWATWCLPCREEMPDMQRFYEDYEEQVIVLGVNLTMAEPDLEAVRMFSQEYGLTFPILLDEDGDAINAYRVVSYPSTFLVDEEGFIREVFRGAIDYETMEEVVENM